MTFSRPPSLTTTSSFFTPCGHFGSTAECRIPDFPEAPFSEGGVPSNTILPGSLIVATGAVVVPGPLGGGGVGEGLHAPRTTATARPLMSTPFCIVNLRFTFKSRLMAPLFGNERTVVLADGKALLNSIPQEAEAWAWQNDAG